MQIATSGTDGILKNNGAGSLRFFNNGSEAIRIDSSQNLGIGTTSPFSKLHVGSRGSASVLSYGSSGDGIVFDFYNLAGSPYTRYANIVSSSSDTSESRLGLWTQAASGTSSEKLTILGDGNVGIGTNSPATMLDISHARSATRPTISSGTRLLIESTANTSAFTAMSILGGNSSGASQINLGDVNDENVGQIGYYHADNSMRFVVNASERVRIDSSGNFGINVSSPSRKFEVDAGAPQIAAVIRNTSTGAVRLGFQDANTTGDNYVNVGAVGDDFVAYAGGGEKFRIDSSGNVGIGTSSPPHKLSVFGTGAGNATVQIEGEGGADPYINFLANNTQHWSVGIDDSDSDKFKISEHSGLGTNDYLVVDTSGNVGIGSTSPDELLTLRNADPTLLIQGNQVSGVHYSEIDFKNQAGSVLGKIGLSYYGGAAEFYRNVPTSWSHVWKVNNSEKMRIDSSGNVGIGTSSPTTQVTASQSANISQVAITSSSNAVAWDATAAANAYHVTTENTTFSAPSNAVEGAIISVEIAQGGTAVTVAWNTVFEFAASTAPTVTATANKTDILLV